MTIPTTDILDIGENIAAITAAIYEVPDTYQQIYERLPEDAGGFVGIWELCAKAGYAFYEEAALFAPEDYYWIEAIENYADQIINYLLGGTVPGKDDLQRLATGSIEKNFINR